MSDTYLQDFGTRRPRRKARPKLDPMAASGRWDDLYLRASKPRLRKVRRQSMRKDIKVRLTPGGKVYTGIKPSGALTAKLGFTSEASAIKYKLDSPSYPARHRELSHERAPWREHRDDTFVRGVRNVYDVLDDLVRKLRFRDPRLNERTRKQFEVLWANRHRLLKLATLPKRMQVTKVVPQASLVKVSVKPKSKRVIPPTALAEFNEIRAKLGTMDEEDKGRVNLLLRQRELYRLIWGQP